MTTLADIYEYSVTVDRMYASASEPTIVISIDANGGGTIGEAYAETTWHYAVEVDEFTLISGSDLRSNGTPATHADMIRTLCNFLAAAGESLYWSSQSDRTSDYAGEYTDAQADFLMAEYDRLSMFAVDPHELGTD